MDLWIQTMEMLILHNGHVDFEQWLGQGSPKMTCPLCLERGLKR